MNKLNFILFDCWGTLISYKIKDPLFLSKEILKNCDNPSQYTPEQVRHFISDLFSTYYTTENEFETSIESLIRCILINLDLKPKMPISQFVTDCFEAQYSPKPVEHIAKLIKFLNEQKIGYAVCSNTVFGKDSTERILKKVIPEIAPKFVLTSSEVAVKKPSPFFFRTCAKQAGVDLSQAIYIGDNFYCDVYGSFKAGTYNSLWVNIENELPPFDIYENIIPKNMKFMDITSYDFVIKYLKKEGI